jgi:hypothetical protein
MNIEFDVVAAAGLEARVRRCRRRWVEAGAEAGEEGGPGHGGSWERRREEGQEAWRAAEAHRTCTIQAGDRRGWDVEEARSNALGAEVSAAAAGGGR